MTNSPMAFRTTGYGSRRDFLSRAGAGCGTLALASLLAGEATADPDPRAPLAAQLGHHVPSAKSVIWLNPEPEPFWGTGDSEMHRYRTFCHVAKTCSTVQDLERVVDDVMKTYFRV